MKIPANELRSGDLLEITPSVFWEVSQVASTDKGVIVTLAHQRKYTFEPYWQVTIANKEDT